MCKAGYDDCDKQADTGCEADLTTPATCGACNNPCPSPANADATCDGVACGISCKDGFVDCDEDSTNGCELEGTPGQCPLLLLKMGLDLPGAIVLDATSLYWVNLGTAANGYHDGSVMKMPLSGGDPTILASNQDAPSGLAVDKTHVYWTTEDYDDGSLGTIRSAPIGSGSVTTIASGQSSPQSIALTSQDIYWVNAGTPPNYTTGSLNRKPLAGGAITPLATNQGYPYGLALSGDRIYWANWKDGTVISMASDGSDSQVHASGQNGPWGVVVSNNDLFWAEVGAGFLWKRSLADSQPPLKIINNASILFAVDSSFVYSGHYKSADTTGSVSRTTRDGLQTTMISKQAYPYAMAVNEKYVYWSTQGTGAPGTGAINRAPKDFVAQ